MSNKNLNNHKVYDSFYASDKEKKQVKSAINITPKSKIVFLESLLFSFVGILICVGAIALHYTVSSQAIFLTIPGLLLILGFSVYNSIIVFKEKAYLFGILNCAVCFLATMPIASIVLGELIAPFSGNLAGLLLLFCGLFTILPGFVCMLLLLSRLGILKK